nr:DUF4111 domain-containing protein [Providencia stuartii]ELR5080438.1 DUF4111 domain-containing protein [Providencia stuartii]
MIFENIDNDIREQVKAACEIIQQNIGKQLNSIHLYGSALLGGLKPLSDIDLLVTVNAPLSEQQRKNLMTQFLNISAWPGAEPQYRALEVTILLNDTIKHWHYPPKRELQFGEWLRDDINAGIYEAPQIDPDIAILITKIWRHNIVLFGDEATINFPAIPREDLAQAFISTLDQWNAPADWENDECNIILALARIMYTLTTGEIESKSVAADWLIERISEPLHQQLIMAAKQTYLTDEVFDASNKTAITCCILAIKAQCKHLIAIQNTDHYVP